jgi:hypothetical protein
MARDMGLLVFMVLWLHYQVQKIWFFYHFCKYEVKGIFVPKFAMVYASILGAQFGLENH